VPSSFACIQQFPEAIFDEFEPPNEGRPHDMTVPRVAVNLVP